MLDYIFALVLLGIVLIAIELRKCYHALPKKELKYRASHGDPLAEKLYRAAAYDSTLDVLIWTVIILGTAASLSLFSKVAPLWLAFIAIAFLLWIAFAWLPSAKVSRTSNRLVALATPLVAGTLNYLHPMVKRIYRLTKTSFEPNTHTGLYDKSDLVGLINKQKVQTDNRLAREELEFILRSIKLSETKVSDVCIPWSSVKTISSMDSIGPILLDELHKSKQLFIPVFEDQDTKNIIGVLNASKFDINSRGLVLDSMDEAIYYLNEEDSTESALKSFAQVGCPIFIVVDDKKHYVGVLTLSNILEQLVGKLSLKDNFDEFLSLDEVSAKFQPKEVETDELVAADTEQQLT